MKKTALTLVAIAATLSAAGQTLEKMNWYNDPSLI